MFKRFLVIAAYYFSWWVFMTAMEKWQLNRERKKLDA